MGRVITKSQRDMVEPVKTEGVDDTSPLYTKSLDNPSKFHRSVQYVDCVPEWTKYVEDSRTSGPSVRREV